MAITRKQIKNGSFLGACKIVRLLGRGSMGETYEAQDILLDRHTVLKVVSPFIEEYKEVSQRFTATGQSLAKINHQNVATIYALKEADGVHYIVMEFVEGHSLKELIRTETRIKPTSVVHYFRQVLEGLKCLHEAGILHQDIKPKNVIVRNDNFVKLVDFGVGRVEGQQVVGTIYYLAPEVIEGEKGTVQSDLYSLGISMYECLTGQKPFQSEDWAEVLQKISSEPMTFPEDGPAIPEGLKQIICRLCEKAPKDRYASAAEALNELRILDNAELVSIPKSAAAIGESPAIIAPPPVFNSPNTGQPPSVRREDASFTRSTTFGSIQTQTTSKKRSAGLFAFLGVLAAVVAAGTYYYKFTPSQATPTETVAATSDPGISPSEGQKIRLTGLENVKFVWSQPSRGGLYIEVARDADFKERVLRETYRSNPYLPTVPLKDGKYFWRLVDQSSSKNLIEPTAFTVITNTAPKVMFPANRHVVQEIKPVQFFWLHKSGVDQYRFQISSQSSFENPTTDILVEGIQTEGISLAAGDYFWRVRAEDPENGTSLWSDMRSIRIAGGPLAKQKELDKERKLAANAKKTETESSALSTKLGPAPTPLMPAPVVLHKSFPIIPVKTKPANVVTKKEVPAKNPGKKSSKLDRKKESKRDSQRDIASVKPNNIKEKNKRSAPKPRGEGLDIIPPPTLKTRGAPSVEAEAATAPGPQLKMPPNGVSIVSLNGTQDPVSFRWENQGEGVTYRLQLAKDASFSKMISNVISKENQFVVSKKLPEGQVYWRVRAETPETSQWSTSFSLDVSK